MSIPLNKVYLNFMKKQGWYENVIQIKLPEIFKRILNKDITDLLVIRNLENGKLIIQVNSSVWKFELIQRTEIIINQINSELEDYKINSIIFL